ncbi:NACHT, LRR and PYD domains-containing protein 3-like [Puntigrus tetrazona]|uniref:NACHT, LRR and PYD domains-containing protein 3-like n=1 Tax=Puntigrus tetrazona TaxID=1606681 RepID=UPI001C8A80E2|nr:NACHT, LRR and PYD domains-containing protein 3-like [Puntigrus tetrazona]
MVSPVSPKRAIFEEETATFRSTQTGDLRQDSHQLDDKLHRVKHQHKTIMKKLYESLCEGIKLQENQTLLNRIYTQLLIIEGESESVNEEHEILQMEKTARTQHSQDTSFNCNDIFNLGKSGYKKKDKLKSVLTKGIAGIGKTVSVQKFILDWAEERPIRMWTSYLDPKMYEECKVVFIFDELMKGERLPSSLIWITSRPAAASQITSKYIDLVAEIQGFNEPQKEEYFHKRFNEDLQGSRIISHIKRSRSLHIMCHIPVFLSGSHPLCFRSSWKKI